MSAAFRDYATSSAFRVDLTHAMATTLWLIAREEEGGPSYIESIHADGFTGRARTHSVSCTRALCERGLIEHHPDRATRPPAGPVFTLTDAGWLVLGLLRIAAVAPAKEAARPQSRVIRAVGLMRSRMSVAGDVVRL